MRQYYDCQHRICLLLNICGHFQRLSVNKIFEDIGKNNICFNNKLRYLNSNKVE